MEWSTGVIAIGMVGRGKGRWDPSMLLPFVILPSSSLVSHDRSRSIGLVVDRSASEGKAIRSRGDRGAQGRSRGVIDRSDRAQGTEE
mmetsp:Transcript_8733/g.24929  ORF Transcript_8733/g.24929 Transcript_8733/m.24929 type:complete len:87 (+) Transcript_8733:180-440(+)